MAYTILKTVYDRSANAIPRSDDANAIVKWWLMTSRYDYTAQQYQTDIQVCDDVETALALAKAVEVDDETAVRIMCVVNSVPYPERSLFRDSEGNWA